MGLTTGTALTALTYAFTFGMKGWKALQSEGFNEAEVDAIKTALDIGAKAAGARRAEPSAVASYLAMVLAAFGQAFERHWVDTQKFRPRTRLARFFGLDEEGQRHEIETRLRMAKLVPIRMGDRAPDKDEFVDLDMLTGSPLHTPYYRELWRVFSDPQLTLEGEPPPLDMDEHTTRQFERHFLLAWWEARTSPAGRKVQDYVLGLDDYRGRVMREILLEDMVNWRERHVFGNVPRHRWDDNHPVPFLPLGQMYVQPHARRAETEEPPTPVLSRLRQWLDNRQPDEYIAVVKADFGLGKSLSARSLACELADDYLRSAAVSVDCWLPVFVRCAEDFPGTSFDLVGTVRRAWQRQAREADIPLAADDRAFDLPDREQRVLYVLDGLDEVSLEHRRLDDLFERLDEKATERHRFLLLSRPAVLPDLRRPRKVAVFDILPFDTGKAGEDAQSQVATWLQAWSATTKRTEPITVEDLAARNLVDLASTPILLFMIAQTWDESIAGQATPSRASIYEAFFVELARGKHRLDTAPHKPVVKAAETLRDRLMDIHELTDEAEPHEAMLWLLSRVAWEERRLSRRGQALTRRHVSNVVHDELELEGDIASVVEIGLLLALQADLQADRPQILFGHKSFREFSTARYWADRLHKIVQASDRDRRPYERTLYGARLLDGEGASFRFLIEMLGTDDARAGSCAFRWNSALRDKLVAWAEDCFLDEDQDFAKDKKSSTAIRIDQRAMLREAALAIGSATPGSSGIVIHDGTALRSLLAWFLATGEWLILIAPGVRAENLRLYPVMIDGADLRKANLQGAHLFQIDLNSANLEQALLQNAVLLGASLQDANLQGANLQHANLRSANLFGSNLENADLRAAHLDFAFLRGANLQRADLQGADLRNAQMQDAELQSAKLQSAKLQGANLRGAKLQGADLFSAVLEGADLRRADLIDTNLIGANLRGVIYDKDTKWPAEFDPDAAGAVQAQTNVSALEEQED